METGDMRVSVVIPNFNGEVLLRKNIPAVLKAKANKANQIGEVIVIDDGSKDGSINFLKDSFPEVKIIKHKVNRGFSSAVNTGVRMAKGEIIALLNNDIVPTNDFLVSVLPHFADPKTFGVSLHEEGYSWAKGSFKNGFLAHEPGQETSDAHLTFWISGGSGVFKRSHWMAVGGMDEKLFSPFYWEDIDLSYRAAKRNFVLLWEPKATVAHEHESTIGKMPKRYVRRIQERNELFFIWKNITSQSMFRKHLGSLFLRMLRHPGYVRVVIAAFFKIGTVKARRRQEKKEAKVSDEAVFARFR